MKHHEDHLFAVADKIREILCELAHDDADEEDEFNEDEVLTCLQLAAQHVAFDCFEVRIGNTSGEQFTRFCQYRMNSEGPGTPQLREQPAAAATAAA